MRIMKMLMIIFLLKISPANAAKDSLIACIDEHPPYQILGEQPKGLHIDALHKLSTLLAKNITFIQSPNFARCVALLERGEVNVIAGLNPTEERKRFAFFAPFKQADSLKVISKQEITIKSYDDFKNKIIGVSRGTLYFHRFDQDKELDKIEMQNDRIGLSLLQKQRIDLMMVSPALLEMFAKDIKNANLKISPITLEELRNKETFFGFSKKRTKEQALIIKKVTRAYHNGFFEVNNDE